MVGAKKWEIVIAAPSFLRVEIAAAAAVRIPLSFEEGRSRLWTATVLINARGGRDEQEKKEEGKRGPLPPPLPPRPLKKEKREKVTMTAEKWRGVGFDIVYKGKYAILFKI